MAKTVRVFEVHLNGKKLCVAGIRKGILAVSMNWVARPKRSDEIGGVAVGGLDDSTNQHVKFAHRRLHIGDELRIKILEKPSLEKPDKPRKHKRNIPA